LSIQEKIAPLEWRAPSTVRQEENAYDRPTPNMIAEKNGPVGRIVFTSRPSTTRLVRQWEAIPVILDDFEKDPALASSW